MRTNAWGLLLGSVCFFACGTTNDELAAGYTPAGANGRRTEAAAAPRGDAGTAVRSDAGTAVRSDAGFRADAADTPPPSRPTGPGAPPSRACAVNADSNGFFELQTPSAGADAISSWARLPVGYDASTPYPMVLGLHGCGDNAKNFAEWAIVPYDDRATQSYVAVSVGGRDGGCWDAAQDEAKVLQVYDDVRTCFYVHQKKVAIAGYSSGGMLAYYTGLRNAYRFSGILIENSGMNFGDQTGAVLAAAEWKLNVGISAHLQDQSFVIGAVRGDRDLLQNAGFPVQYRELDGDHDGNSGDWHEFLLPKVATFVAP